VEFAAMAGGNRTSSAWKAGSWLGWKRAPTA